MNTLKMRATFIEVTGLGKDNYKSFSASLMDSDSSKTVEFNDPDTISITKFEDVVITDPYHIDEYTGSYDVTPNVDPQTLETKDKKMLDDVTIRKIPYYEVSNIYDGTTIYIGSDLGE